MRRRRFVHTLCATAVLPAAQCASVKQVLRTSYHPQGTMPLRTLGKTGMQVSMLSFGSHLSPELIAKPALRDRMIKLGYEGGINLFDIYDHGGYKQFKPMGLSLSGFRKSVYISLCAVEDTPGLQKEIDGALTDLRTSFIDLYRLYTVDDERIGIMEKNKQAGKIRAIGVVAHDVKVLDQYLDRYGASLDFVMLVANFHHNQALLDSEYAPNDYSGFIPKCQKLSIGILGIKPMGSDGMVELAKKQGFFRSGKVNIAQAMLRYVYRNQTVHTVMPSMNNMEEVAVNLESAYAPVLSSTEENILRDLSNAAASTNTAYLPPHYRWLEQWSDMKQRRHA